MYHYTKFELPNTFNKNFMNVESFIIVYYVDVHFHQ